MWVFLYAHHFITQQRDFRNLLDPILVQDWGAHTDHEYDFLAETLNVAHDGTKLSAKIFLLRTNPKFTTKMQKTLSRIYAVDNETNLETLSRYKFIPLTTDAAISSEMLLGLVRAQSVFGQNVFVYVCHNVSAIETKFKIKDPSETTTAEDTNVTTYDYSLRNWFYDLEDEDKTPLFHAVYTMPNSTTIKILCERSKRYKVLNLLHDLLEITTDFSPPEAIAAYFPQAQSHPFTVEKFPKSAQACGTYVNELASYALGNPQSDEIEDPYESYASATTATKRNRQGEPVAQASTVKTVTQPSQNVLQQLEENQKKLNAIEQDQLSRETTMSKLDETLKRLDSRVSTNDAAKTKLANAQITQGNLINTINKKQTFMENTIIKLCDHFNIEVDRPTQDFNTEDTEMEEPPDDLHTQNPGAPPGDQGEKES